MDGSLDPRWEHFSYLGGNAVRCNLCSRESDVTNAKSVNPMSRHLEKYHAAAFRDYKAAMRAFLLQKLSAMPEQFRRGLDLAKFRASKLPSLDEVREKWPMLLPHFQDYYVVISGSVDKPAPIPCSEQEWTAIGGEKYSLQLEEAIGQMRNGQKCELGVAEYARLKESLRNRSTDDVDRKRNFAYYCYMLLDSTQIHIEGCKLYWDGTFEEFLDGIFYIGKGVGGRSTFHCEDAALHNLVDDREKMKRILPNGLKCDETAVCNSALTGRKNKNRLDRIHTLWRENLPVIVFENFTRNISEETAYGFESAMLIARGPKGMSNVNLGMPTGPYQAWSTEDMARLGTRLLLNAYQCFKTTMFRVFYEQCFEYTLKSFIFQALQRRKKLDRVLGMPGGTVCAKLQAGSDCKKDESESCRVFRREF